MTAQNPPTSKFLQLAISDGLTKSAFLASLRVLQSEMDDWAESRITADELYVNVIRKVGRIAAHFGYSDLHAQSRKLESTSFLQRLRGRRRRHEATYQLVIKCIARCLPSKEAPLPTAATDVMRPKTARRKDPSAMPKRFADALEWQRLARLKANLREWWDVYAWAQKEQSNYPMDLPEHGETFANYLRCGTRFRRIAIENAGEQAVGRRSWGRT